MDTNSEFERKEGRRFVFGFCIPSQIKVLFSIVSTFVWLGFSLYLIAFLGGNYTFFQNVALLIIAFLVFSVSNALVWVIE